MYLHSQYFLLTVGSNDFNIEMGAEWIHGQVGNPIFNIAKSHGFVDVEQPKYFTKAERTYVMPGKNGFVDCMKASLLQREVGLLLAFAIVRRLPQEAPLSQKVSSAYVW